MVNAIHCDRQDSRRWHTLYLIAVRLYRPTLTLKQQKNCDDWREKVKASLNSGEKTYVREACYDELLAVLFPEMCQALEKSYGTTRNLAVETSPAAKPTSWPQMPHFDVYLLRGHEFEAWARRNPESAAAWLNSPAGHNHK